MNRIDRITYALLGLASEEIRVESDEFSVEVSGRLDLTESMRDWFEDSGYIYFFDQSALTEFERHPTKENLRELLDASFGVSEGLGLLEKFSEFDSKTDAIEWLATAAWQLNKQDDLRPARELHELRVGDKSAPETGEQGEDRLANAYLWELTDKFPKMVKRASLLEPLQIAVDSSVSNELKAYVSEISRCYVHGHFLACAVLCRSTVELVIEEFLTRRGLKATIEKLPHGKDGLFGLLALSRTLKLAELGPFIAMAERVRLSAKTVVHPKPPLPNPETVRQMLEDTRGVVQALSSMP